MFRHSMAALGIAVLALTGCGRLLTEDFSDRLTLACESYGKKLVAIVPVEDLDLLERIKRLRQDGKVQAALREAEAGDVTPWEDLKQALDL